jgi:hypothetical protein
VTVVLAAVVSVATVTVASALRWGRTGHEIVGEVAAGGLPAELPAFFRESVAQLSWLNYEPDRWRDRASPESNEAFQYDHFIDLEPIPAAALAAPHRFAYLEMLSKAGVDRPEHLGLLPFRILELTNRLTVGFRQWRAETDPQRRAWIEQRIISDAGILGHYIADGANPHHTTIHFNGWDANTANPQEYTRDRTFHRRFESDFVNAQIRAADVRPHASAPPRELTDLRAEVIAYIRRTHGVVRRLYDLEKRTPFGAETRAPGHREFAIERLAAGAEMLRSVWFTAWRMSAAD